MKRIIVLLVCAGLALVTYGDENKFFETPRMKENRIIAEECESRGLDCIGGFIRSKNGFNILRIVICTTNCRETEVGVAGLRKCVTELECLVEIDEFILPKDPRWRGTAAMYRQRFLPKYSI